jgi:dihydrofolate synthase/folylpolyglutamate synthase
MIVLGMVSDKDVDSSLALMPADAVYYFTQASVKRALDRGKLYEKARKHGLSGRAFPDVPAAFMAALQDSSEDDVIYVGGSNFVVGDLLRFIDGRPVKSLLNK